MSKAKKSLKASMTVEASIALPLFIFFFVNIMTLLSIVRVQSDMEAALHQTGSEMSLLAFDLKYGKELLGAKESLDSDMIQGAAGILFAKRSVGKYLGNSLEKGCVTGGMEGISFLGSGILEDDDIIDIVMDYRIHPLIPVIGFKEFKTESRFYGHAWTGYDIFNGLSGDENSEELVYVTEHGEVYHRSVDCVHLHISIRSIDYRDLKSERNKDGKKYYACEYCGGSIGGGNVFITEYGDRYHSSVNCPGLKRKIYTIPLSEVGGRRPCSSCGY